MMKIMADRVKQLVQPLGDSRGPYNHMVTTLGSCVKWPLVFMLRGVMERGILVKPKPPEKLRVDSLSLNPTTMS